MESQGIKGEILTDSSDQLQSWMDLHYGMFIHLGLYSQLGGMWKGEPIKVGYSEQIQMWAEIPQEDYAAVSKDFTLEHFDAKAIVSLAKEAGMKYLVVTSKHHDGYCLFDTKTTDYNVVKTSPFGKDVLRLLADECQKQGLKFGLYYSLVDWNEGHAFDHNNNNKIPESMESLIEEQLTELMTGYGDIAEVWFDMGHPTVEQSEKFSQIVRTYQPKAGINGRIWNNKGDFRTLNDNQVPSEKLDGPWQTPASIYRETWGYREWQVREDFDLKVLNLLQTLISVRARGGNYLLNIGPKGDGSVVSFESDVLKEIGQWLKRHKEAVIGTHPTRFAKPDWGEMTVKHNHLYLHLFEQPEDRKIKLNGLVTEVEQVVEDGYDKELEWSKEGTELVVYLPDKLSDPLVTTLKATLKGELQLIPEQTVVSEKESWVLTSQKLEKGFNFVDEGNYTSLKKSNIRLSGYFKNNNSGDYRMKMTGQANEALDYILSIGESQLVVTGKDLNRKEIGPFSLDKDHQIVPVHIQLHEPQNKYQDLELECHQLTIQKNK